MSEAKVKRTLLAASILSMSFGFASTPVSASSLPTCASSYGGIMKPVETGVRAAVVKYYAIKKLGPTTIFKNREQVKVVKLWTVGIHWCLNTPGSKGSYVGAVPKTALFAVEVYALHKPRPDSVASNFLMVAKMPTTGWKVVSEGTGP